MHLQGLPVSAFQGDDGTYDQQQKLLSKAILKDKKVQSVAAPPKTKLASRGKGNDLLLLTSPRRVELNTETNTA